MKTRQDTLLAALQRKLPASDPAPASDSSPAPVPTPAARAGAAPVPRRVGKPVQFWMHEEDRKLIRELAAWLAGQGIRPTDSMVVRAALHLVKPGSGFLDAYRQAAKLDGRLRTHRTGSAEMP